MTETRTGIYLRHCRSFPGLGRTSTLLRDRWTGAILTTQAGSSGTLTGRTPTGDSTGRGCPTTTPNSIGRTSPAPAATGRPIFPGNAHDPGNAARFRTDGPPFRRARHPRHATSSRGGNPARFHHRRLSSRSGEADRPCGGGRRNRPGRRSCEIRPSLAGVSHGHHRTPPHPGAPHSS